MSHSMKAATSAFSIGTRTHTPPGSIASRQTECRCPPSTVAMRHVAPKGEARRDPDVRGALTPSQSGTDVYHPVVAHGGARRSPRHSAVEIAVEKSCCRGHRCAGRTNFPEIPMNLESGLNQNDQHFGQTAHPCVLARWNLTWVLTCSIDLLFRLGWT